MEGNGLGETTLRIFRFIVSYKRHNDGNSPTLAEIGAYVGMDKKNVRPHLDALMDAGRLQRPAAGRLGRARHLVVVGGRWSYDAGG